MPSEREQQANLKHGLTSSTLVVLPEEDRQEYEEVLRGFRDSLQPEAGVEDALVLRLAQGHWRSLRSRCVKTSMLNTSANLQRRQAQRMVENCPEHLNLHEAIGVGFMVMPERWQMYLRYDTTISRDFFKTLDTLTKLQRLRQVKTSQATSPAPLVFTAGGGTQLSDSGIRFVSQNDTSSAPGGAPVTEPRASASAIVGINRRAVGDERALQERSSEPS